MRVISDTSNQGKEWGWGRVVIVTLKKKEYEGDSHLTPRYCVIDESNLRHWNTKATAWGSSEHGPRILLK